MFLVKQPLSQLNRLTVFPVSDLTIKRFDCFTVYLLNSYTMKEKTNPLAGLVDAMKAHDTRLARKESAPTAKPAAPPVQTVATVEKPRRVGDKIFCAARYTRGQITKIDQIILLTHKERGVRLTQSDVLKKAVDRLPAAPLEEGEIAEILAESGRKQLNS
jgi:hypothetical protein